ncbi:unnamed protein product [Kuraishia capsulata CBS 1993]|uniref:Protein-serine/threonine kinase n=1 Tax=Kuraishia capsulata CBS 1993 TaxID=1382522 RepID=W6MHU0_9ASCO|nr:uncharacterized protein KUCA_T00001337001 [Kuraishia capsulata CBS 1993]CDK25368.1 unnamed protein product [Kuraishia capsulata CBS 1993]
MPADYDSFLLAQGLRTNKSDIWHIYIFRSGATMSLHARSCVSGVFGRRIPILVSIRSGLRLRQQHHQQYIRHTWKRHNSSSHIPLSSHEDITRQHQIRSSLESIIYESSNKPLPEISLNDLLKFNTATKHNKELMILQNANETVMDMLTLIATRLKVFRQLPYIVVLNPNIAEIYDAYLETLKVLLEFVASVQGDDSKLQLDSFKLSSLEQNERLIGVLQKSIDIHTDNLTVLSKGFEEIAPLNLFNGAEFLDNHLKERIMMRLVANHHMSLSAQLAPLSNSDIDSGALRSIGVVDKKLDVMQVIRESIDFVNGMCLLKYDERVKVQVETFIIKSDGTTTFTKYEPQLNVDGIDAEVFFPFIPSHLEYVLNEVFKNSARALIESQSLAPIQITLVAKDYQNLKENEHLDTVLEIRISDKGGGIPPEAMERLFEYSFTTFDSEEAGDSYKTLNNIGGNGAVNIIAGMGYGLPLSRIYVELFGGDLDVQTIYGHGTDVYIRLRGPDASLLK